MARKATIGGEIRRARDAAGLTQAAVAHKMRCRVPYVSALENSVRPLSVINAIRIAKACRCRFQIDGRGFHVVD